MSIYVEAFIRGPLEEVWRLTQTPELHERWDLRFTSITYLERDDETGSQRFCYATRIGFGMQVEGWGESVGDRSSGSQRTSALKFGSEDRRSLIRSGSGYWKYEQVEGGVRFITGYDYEARWGGMGKVIDRFFFRPLMGWATAWSFDRLRLWIEKGAEPRASARLSLIHLLSAIALSVFWIGMGAYLLNMAGLPVEEAPQGLSPGGPGAVSSGLQTFVGGSIFVLGLSVLPFARDRGPWIISLGAAPVLVTFLILSMTALDEPGFEAVVPLLTIPVAIAGWLTLDGLPRAGRCLRRPPRNVRKRGAP